MEIKRYSFIGRIRSALITFQEKTWIDGTDFTLWQRINRTIENYKDMPIKNYNRVNEK